MKQGICPYCDYIGDLYWYHSEYVCQECIDNFEENRQIDEYWQKEDDLYND